MCLLFVAEIDNKIDGSGLWGLAIVIINNFENSSGILFSLVNDDLKA